MPPIDALASTIVPIACRVLSAPAGQEMLPSPMESATIACNARLLRGGVCGETASIGNLNVFYNTPKAHRVVRETHYHVECPKCGRRVQVVTAGAR